MCGIVGLSSPHPVRNVLLDGLTRLEHRGYDSAGLALIHDSKISVYKEVGRVPALAAAVPGDAPGTTGIAHTRWATHGGVTQANAHPHRSWDGQVAVVHNGILDNGEALRAELLSQGVPLASDTDSEVLAHLVARALLAGADPAEAVRRALRRAQGTWGLLFAFAAHPGLLVAARMGSPLAVGLRDEGAVVASDVLALAPLTDRVRYLEDGDLAVVEGADLRVERGGRAVARPVHLLEGVTVGRRPLVGSALRQEIAEQPAALQRCLAGRLDPVEGRAHLGGPHLEPRDIVSFPSATLLACGTSLHAAEVGAQLFEALADLPTRAELASEHLSRGARIDPRALCLALSQSGETWDTLAALREVQQQGAEVLGVVNVVGSTIARTCGRGVYLHAGPELAVASTKAFTSQVAALSLLALQLGRSRRLSLAEGRAFAEALAAIPGQVEATLQALEEDPAVDEAARLLAQARAVVFIGRGVSWPVAREGALKLQELAWLPCQAHAAGELKHGPLALVDARVPVVAIVPDDTTRRATLHNLAEAHSRGAPVVAICTEGDEEVRAIADVVLETPRAGHRLLSPLLTVLPLQVLAADAARLLERDLDRPRHLAKAITVG